MNEYSFYLTEMQGLCQGIIIEVLISQNKNNKYIFNKLEYIYYFY